MLSHSRIEIVLKCFHLVFKVTPIDFWILDTLEVHLRVDVELVNFCRSGMLRQPYLNLLSSLTI
jgi:hypothetical protein